MLCEIDTINRRKPTSVPLAVTMIRDTDRRVTIRTDGRGCATPRPPFIVRWLGCLCRKGRPRTTAGQYISFHLLPVDVRTLFLFSVA